MRLSLYAARKGAAAIKILVKPCVILVSIAVSFVCLFIILYSGEFIAMLKASLDMAFAGFNLSAWGFVALLISTIFLQVCAMASMCFTAAIKGCSFNRDKLLHGLIWYVIFYFGCTRDTGHRDGGVSDKQGNRGILLKPAVRGFLDKTFGCAPGSVLHIQRRVLLHKPKGVQKGVNVD